MKAAEDLVIRRSRFTFGAAAAAWIGLMIFVLTASGCPPRPDDVTSAYPGAEEKREPQVVPPPLLWRVSGERGDSWIFGTLHFGASGRLSDLPAPVREAISQASVFVLEAEQSGVDPMQVAELMVLPQGPSLEEQLGEERWARVQGLLDGAFDPMVARRLRPWVVESVIISKLVQTPAPMDATVLKQARAANAEVVFLETWDQQMTLLSDVAGVETLAQIVDDPEGFRRRTREIARDYAAGDLESLARHIHVGGESEAAEQLFHERNAVWLPRIVETMEGGGAFVAVGAGHLVGEDNLLELMQEEGLAVERVVPAAAGPTISKQ